MTMLKISVVTGGNRGLGFETCRQLAERGMKVILTSRNVAAGLTRTEELVGQGCDVFFHSLDVTDPKSICKLADYIRAEFGRLDILVNNAGIFPDPFPGRGDGSNSVFDSKVETVRTAMETNTYGPLMVCQQLIPLMEGYGRVVNVSSGMGQLSEMNGCCPGYRLSKTALNAVTRIFADELSATGVKINSVCPGWVRTDMGGPEAEISPQEGADGIVWLATLPDDGPSGGFFRYRKPISW